jgi:hypothetical protein
MNQGPIVPAFLSPQAAIALRAATKFVETLRNFCQRRPMPVETSTPKTQPAQLDDQTVSDAKVQTQVAAVAEAIKDPAERNRVDQVIRDRAFADLGKAGTMIGHGTIKNNWVRPKVCGAYGDDWLARSCINYVGIWANILGEVVYYKGRVDSTASRSRASTPTR